MSRRRGKARIHRTTIILTILSEGPLDGGLSLRDLAHEIDDGEFVGLARWTPSEPLDDGHVATALAEVGNDGTFFGPV